MYLPLFFSVASLALGQSYGQSYDCPLGQSYDCPSANEVTLENIGKIIQCFPFISNKKQESMNYVTRAYITGRTQGSHGSLYPWKVLTFEYGSLGTGKVVSKNNFCKMVQEKSFFFRLINECLIIRYYRTRLVSSPCIRVIMLC